jgi:hypothetical protein
MGQAHEAVDRIIEQPDYSCHFDKSIWSNYLQIAIGRHKELMSPQIKCIESFPSAKGSPPSLKPNTIIRYLPP